MKAIRGWTGAVLGAMLGGSVALGQSSPLSTSSTTPTSPVVTITTEPLPHPGGQPSWPGGGPVSTNSPSLLSPSSDVLVPAPPGGPSPGLANPGPVESWLNHHQSGCCGPVGGHGPVSYDVYFRTGASVPFGGGTLSQVLEVGWLARGGVRTLFFNPSGDSAWVVDANLEVVRNNANQSKLLSFFGQPVQPRGITRTNFSLAFGKDWYTQGPGFINGSSDYTNVSYGFDFGGRWGTSHADFLRLQPQIQFVNTARQYDVIGGMYGGLNANWEMPMGGWTFMAGGRLEGAVTFTDVLPGYGGTLYDINLLLTAGVRY